jgi:hypothetical protein
MLVLPQQLTPLDLKCLFSDNHGLDGTRHGTARHGTARHGTFADDKQ